MRTFAQNYLVRLLKYEGSGARSAECWHRRSALSLAGLSREGSGASDQTSERQQGGGECWGVRRGERWDAHGKSQANFGVWSSEM